MARETIALCGRSALEYIDAIRLGGAGGFDVSRAAFVRPDPRRLGVGSLNMRAIQQVHESARQYCSDPLHILVGINSPRTPLPGVVYHVLENPVITGSLITTELGCLCSSPEFALLQCARYLPTIQLALTTFALCGEYAVSGMGQGGIAGSRKARKARKATSIFSIASFLEGYQQAHPKAHGARRLRATLGLALDGAASPIEARLALYLMAPYRMGGYGISAPKLNQRIQLPTRVNAIGGKVGIETLHADLCWPKSRLIIEYDSNEHHLEARQHAWDAARRNAIQEAKYKVITVTAGHLRSPARLHEAVSQVQASLGLRDRTRECDYDWQGLRSEFWRSLFC